MNKINTTIEMQPKKTYSKYFQILFFILFSINFGIIFIDFFHWIQNYKSFLNISSLGLLFILIFTVAFYYLIENDKYSAKFWLIKVSN